jgi:hypothetical protein
MKKLSLALLLAAGLFFIDVSPASAHTGVDRVHVNGYGYRPQLLRGHEMPTWLRRDHRFQHWYRHSPLRHYHQISWNQLLEIYQWERRYFGSHRYVGYEDGRHWKGKRRHHRDD